MPERDPAAVRVHIARLVALAEVGVLQELEDDRRERLVHLDHRHVVPRQARLRERAVARLRVAVQHQMRVDAGDPEAEEARARHEAELRRLLLRRDEHCGGAVDDLARVARRDLAVGNERRLKCRQLLERRGADCLVDGETRAHHRRRAAAVFVRRGHVEIDRNDLLLEAALFDRAPGALMRLERVAVELLAGEVPLVGDLLGRDSLHHDVEALEHGVGHRAVAGAHRDARHHLDATRDDEIELTRPDRRRRVEVRLHRRPALAVDGRAAHGDRPACRQRDVAADVPGLLVDLGDAPPLDVLDLARVDAVTREEAVDDLRGEIVAADVRERAVPLADRAPDGVDDECVGFSGHAADSTARQLTRATQKRRIGKCSERMQRSR